MIKNLINNMKDNKYEPTFTRFVLGIIIGIILSFTLLVFNITFSPYLSVIMNNGEIPNSSGNLGNDILFYSRILMVLVTGYVAGRISGGFYLAVGLLSNAWLLAQQFVITYNILEIFTITFLAAMVISSVLGTKIGQHRYQTLSSQS